jgi:hypothetical protein
MPKVRGDWDQAVTRHDQDDVELAHRLAPGVNIQAVEWNFERLGIPSRKIGRPIEGGPNTLAGCESADVRDPLLSLCLGCGSRLCWKLEHCCFLMFKQVS